jgi:undecaprenyl-diphosphatase
VDGGVLVRFDVRVATWVGADMPGWAESVARWVTWLGSTYVLLPVVLLACLWLGRRTRWIDALVVTAVFAAELVLVQVLKAAFGRARPSEGSAIPLPDSYSFPSGHATAAVAVLGVIVILLTAGAPRRRRGPVVGAVFALAVCIGATRVVLDVHYVSDVAAGFCLALAILAAGLVHREAILERRGRRPGTARSAARGDRGPARLGP